MSERKRGTLNGASKVSEAAVRDIRANYVPGRNQANPGTGSILGRKYGINRRTVRSIAIGETWDWFE